MWTSTYLIAAVLGFARTEIYVTTTCPNGWMSYEKSCYLFADEISVDWIEATHFCTTHNATLVVIESHGEDMLLIDQANRLFRQNGAGASFWIGATDDEVEGNWVWYTTHQQLDKGYTNWASNEPDNGNNQDCAALWGGYHFQWGSAYCTNTHSHVICEKKLTEGLSCMPEVIG